MEDLLISEPLKPPEPLPPTISRSDKRFIILVITLLVLMLSLGAVLAYQAYYDKPTATEMQSPLQ